MKAILLAAGFSSRMGELKQVMNIYGRPMILRIAEPLLAAGLELLIVIGHEGERVKTALYDIPCEYIVNPHPEQGMFSSVKLGCLAVPRGEPCLISTCDCPGIKPQTVQQVKETLEREQTKVIIPTFRGRRGHPSGLPVFLVDQIRTAPSETPGLNSFWRNTPEIVFPLEVNDPAVLRDLDRLEDVNELGTGNWELGTGNWELGTQPQHLAPSTRPT
jgi:molybdenum cofactor cytidylyltransferase